MSASPPGRSRAFPTCRSRTPSATRCRARSRTRSTSAFTSPRQTALFDVGFATFTRNGPTKVDFTRDDRAPMLSIAFEHDHIVPPKAARHNVEKYGNPNVITAYKEFPRRPHAPGAPGWEEVADYAIEWASNPRAVEPAE